MSGPKVSIYSLTGEARRIVNGQIRCEQDALICANQIREMLGGFGIVGDGLSRSVAALEMLQRRFGTGADEIKEIQAFQTRFQKEAQQLEREFSANMPSVSPKYTITQEALEQKKHMLARIRTLKERVQNLKIKADSYIEKGKAVGTAERNRAYSVISEYGSNGVEPIPHTTHNVETDAKTLRQSISADLGSVISFDSDTEDNPHVDAIIAEKEKAKGILSELLQGELSIELRNDINALLARLERITTVERIKAFEAVSVNHVQDRVTKYRLELLAKKREYKEAYARYEVLCKMAEVNPQKIVFSETAISIIEEETTKLEQLLLKQQEQSYIRDNVNDVMQEMGYEVIGSRNVTKRNGRKFRNELYRFHEGTAVNITISPEGQISMELGGIAKEDRIPDAEETELLTGDMKSFCSEFSEFERRLRERGIIVGNRIALSPPSAEYATIINLEDYDVMDESKVSIIDAKKKKRIAEKKTMRRDD